VRSAPRYASSSERRTATSKSSPGNAERRPKALAGAGARVAAVGDLVGQRVVGRALLLVAQHVVGFVDLAHAPLGVRLLADVRVVLARQLAVGLADVLVGRVALHAERLVIVLEFHVP